MKRLLLIAICSFCIFSAAAKRYSVGEIPNVQMENRYCFTSNPDGILSAEAVARIDSICYDLRHRGIAQTAVVAVREIKGDDVFEFAYELFSSWGVGSKSDSGIGILLVEEEREIRFVTGYGIEGVLPDALCKRIQTQYMLPYVRAGDYDSGMVAGVMAIRSVLNGSELDAGGNDDYVDEEMREIVPVFLFMGLLVLGIILLAFYLDRQSRKCPNCKQLTLMRSDSYLISRELGWATYRDIYICSKCGARVERNRNEQDTSGNNRRGGGGPIIMGGGFGRGFGGGSIGGGWGGGRFGGGGAGSRW